MKHNVLLILAQIVGALFFLYVLGYLLTFFWTSHLYKASMIKGLYKVKHTSSPSNLGQYGEKLPEKMADIKAEDKALLQKNSEKGKKKFGCLSKKKEDLGPPTWAQRFEVASGARISSMWDRLDLER